ncbi:hypothetical protein [Bacteroides sp.]|uniref:hypothetical protein n=1 Tax=Bacteroides sp. TaxID=29523 RepID=UPI002583D46C|nr:hypothetical protein [Bacteroides sp.]
MNIHEEEPDCAYLCAGNDAALRRNACAEGEQRLSGSAEMLVWLDWIACAAQEESWRRMRRGH